MSIFDSRSGMNPLPWLQEKSLRALEESARLVDLANEKDTSPWYAKELKHRANALIGRLAPIVALLNQDGDAAAPEEWQSITERGSFALAGWCKKHDIHDPMERKFDLLAKEREQEETASKAERPGSDDAGPDDKDDLRVLDLRCSVYASLTRRLLRNDIPEPARRMLLWALSHLYLADGPDVVSLSRRFLPTDIGVTVEEAGTAYVWLTEHGLIERVDERADGDGLRLRLVAEGINESKQPLPASSVVFGFPGGRVAGKPTTGNELRVELPDPYARTLARWKFDEDDRKALSGVLQEHLGTERAFVEDVSVERGDHPAVYVRLRYPWDEDDRAMTEALERATLAWVRARIAPQREGV